MHGPMRLDSNRASPDRFASPDRIRDICNILAVGLLRLRRRTVRELDPHAEHGGDKRESSLHFTGRRSGHAKPKLRRDA